MNESVRKFISGIIVGAIIFGSISFYAELTRAVNPAPSYIYPSDGATFVSVWRGHGVNITVNVTDADGDLQQVILKWNNGGIWETFYSNTSLGGVSYHNVTVLNTNFTGSWTTYEWQVCAKDSSVWSNTTYNFTTEYVFGDIYPIMIDDNYDLVDPVIYKNNTNEYFLFYAKRNIGIQYYHINSVLSNNMLFLNKSITDLGSYSTHFSGDEYLKYDLPSIAVTTYNGKIYLFLQRVHKFGSTYYLYTYYNKYNGTWSGYSTITSFPKWYFDSDSYSTTNNIVYYDGTWWYFAPALGGTQHNTPQVNIYYGSPPNNWTLYGKLPYTYHFDSSYYNQFSVTSAILKGKLVIAYKDYNYNLRWNVFDGVSFTDKGTLNYISNSRGDTISLVKDPVNNQLILVYVNSSGNMYYRILTDPDGTWSEPHLLFQPESGYTVGYPHVQYIDHRVVVTFSYNLRGNYNIYMITAPEYLSSPSGVLQQYNRIQFPDSTPNQKNVNSSVFYFENIDSRNITWINWSFSDIGSIQCENNIRLWGSTDNSTWTAIGTTDANGYINMTTTTWSGGLPWQAGEIRYFRIEILDVGSVPEDLHSTDSIILKVGLA